MTHNLYASVYMYAMKTRLDVMTSTDNYCHIRNNQRNTPAGYDSFLFNETIESILYCTEVTTITTIQLSQKVTEQSITIIITAVIKSIISISSSIFSVVHKSVVAAAVLIVIVSVIIGGYLSFLPILCLED